MHKYVVFLFPSEVTFLLTVNQRIKGKVHRFLLVMLRSTISLFNFNLLFPFCLVNMILLKYSFPSPVLSVFLSFTPRQNDFSFSVSSQTTCSIYKLVSKSWSIIHFPALSFAVCSLLCSDIFETFNPQTSSVLLHVVLIHFTLFLTIWKGVVRVGTRNEDTRVLTGTLPILGYMTSSKKRMLEPNAT